MNQGMSSPFLTLQDLLPFEYNLRSAPVIAKLLTVSMAFLATGSFWPALAHADGLADIQKQLESAYPTAKATADGTDLVTAGAVLVLQKDHLQMCKVEQPMSTANYYKKGAITQGGLGGFFKTMNVLSKLSAVPGLGGVASASASAGAAGAAGGAPAATDMREFVAGEKFFVTQISTGPDGVVFAFISDPIKDQRYKSSLKFPFPRGSTPSPDAVAAMVAEVIKVDAAEAQPEQAEAPAAAPTPTKTVALGQSRDAVIAMFGVPTKVVQLGAKEIDFFQDMKVTFIKNKVSNVE
jgi:hypothetical protein